MYGKQPRIQGHTCVDFRHFSGIDVVVNQDIRMFRFKVQG